MLWRGESWIRDASEHLTASVALLCSTSQSAPLRAAGRHHLRLMCCVQPHAACARDNPVYLELASGHPRPLGFMFGLRFLRPPAETAQRKDSLQRLLQAMCCLHLSIDTCAHHSSPAGRRVAVCRGFQSECSCCICRCRRSRGCRSLLGRGIGDSLARRCHDCIFCRLYTTGRSYRTGRIL